MDNFLTKSIIIERFLGHLKEAKYIEQFNIDESHPNANKYTLIAGKVKYRSYGGGIEKRFERKYDLTLGVRYPNIPFWALPFAKMFPQKYYIHFRLVGSQSSFFGEYISIEKAEFEQIENTFILNYNRILKETLDKSIFDGDPDVIEERQQNYSFTDKRVPLKEYLLRKNIVKY